MNRFSERGYVIKENGPVYYTKDMDKTVAWFERILGWYSEIDARDTHGTGVYGCVYSIPPEIEKAHIAPFTGIHLFYGEPQPVIVAFMLVRGIDALHAYVQKNGWSNLSEIIHEPWGAKTCTITTIDESILRFFE